MVWHGSTPLVQPGYPTAEESKKLHTLAIDIVREVMESSSIKTISVEPEYRHDLGIVKENTVLCASSKADLVYTISLKGGLLTLYIELSSTRINIVKPWQALLRGIALYYERRLPVGVVIISPEKIMYKLLEDSDQEKILKRIHRGLKSFKPSPNLCSLCELQQYCPYRAV